MSKKSYKDKEKLGDKFDTIIVLCGLLMILSLYAIFLTVLFWGDDGMPAIKIELIIGGIALVIGAITAVIYKILQLFGRLNPDIDSGNGLHIFEWIFGFIIFSNIMDRFLGKKK